MPARAARDPSIPNFLERALIRTGFLAEIIPERARSIPAFLARAPIQTGLLVQIPAKGTSIPTFLERALIRTGLLPEILKRTTSIPAFLSSALIQTGLLAQMRPRRSWFFWTTAPMEGKRLGSWCSEPPHQKNASLMLGDSTWDPGKMGFGSEYFLRFGS